MNKYFIAAIAGSTLMMGSALAQTSTIPTGPAASNSGQNSADPMASGATTTFGYATSGTARTQEDMGPNLMPTSPQAENGGQNSADPASSRASGPTVGPATADMRDSGSVPTSPAFENSGTESAAPAS